MHSQACSFLVKLAVCTVLVSVSAWPQTGSWIIDTFAGQPAFGDGGPAVAALLHSPSGVALDGAGNLYFTDRYHHRIRKVDTSGIITTVAGTGESGFGGDGGPAVSAKLAYPFGVAVDGAGNVYISDRTNHRVRKVDSTGVITTIAGTGDFGFGGDGGPAVSAQLRHPLGLAVDGAGNLYFVDLANHRIRKVDSSGVITTVAGTGEKGFGGDGGQAVSAQLNYPNDVVVDGAGNLYIADASNDRIRKVDSSGIITTVAGTGEKGFGGDGGQAVSARLNTSSGVVLDGAGNLYIADRHNSRIRKVDSSGVITTIAGTGEIGFDGDGGPAVSALLNSPTGVAVDVAGNVYFSDEGNQLIRKVDTSGVITTVAGMRDYGPAGDGGPAVSAWLATPNDVATDGAGNLYISGDYNHLIRKVDTSGVITTLAGSGGGPAFGGDGGLAVSAWLWSPTGVVVDVAGNVYIADSRNHRIRKVDTPGIITTVAGSGGSGFVGDGGPAVSALLNYPRGVAADGAGNLYIAAFGSRIRKVDTSGVITTVAGTGDPGFGGDDGQAVAARLAQPDDVAADGAGNLYIADTANSRIRKVDTTGVITTVAGTGSYGSLGGFGGDGGPAVSALLNYPRGVAVDGAGNLYIADTGNHRIRKVDTTGVITTIAGTGESDFGGDGGPAIAARLDSPRGVATDSAGNVYIADTGNNRVRILTPTGYVPPPPPPPPPPPTGGGTTAPSAPSNLTAAAGDGQVVLTWEAPARDGGAAITDYEYRIDRRNPWISIGSTNITHTVTGLDNGTAYVFEVRAVNRIGKSFSSNRAEATPEAPEVEVFTLDFAHFANGTSITSDLVFVNLSTQPARPAIYFYDTEGAPIAAESVLEVTADLEIQEDGGLTVQTEMDPLGVLTISTHGRGELVSGSVKVVSEGLPIGGGLRYNLPAIGEAVVGASPPVGDALFPVRRQEGGINTGVAIHNLGEEAMEARCELMREGVLRDFVSISLEANGQTSWMIDQAFPAADTSDFTGSVRCAAPGRGRFTAIAVEIDAARRIFISVVPVAGREAETSRLL